MAAEIQLTDTQAQAVQRSDRVGVRKTRVDRRYYWQATMSIDGMRLQRNFSIAALGNREARAQAIRTREDWERRAYG